jgi:hypothetical protein
VPICPPQMVGVSSSPFSPRFSSLHCTPDR